MIPGKFLHLLCYCYMYLIFQEFHFPLSVVVCHLVLKFVFASLCRTIWECCRSKQRVVLNWGNYVKKVAPTGISSGLDVGLSNWGLELIPVSLWVYLVFCMIQELHILVILRGNMVVILFSISIYDVISENKYNT